MSIKIDEPTSVGNNRNNDFNNQSLRKIPHITLNSEPTNDNHVATKSYLGSLSVNDRNRRDMSTLFNDHEIDSDNNKVTSLDSMTVNRNPTIVKEVSD